MSHTDHESVPAEALSQDLIDTTGVVVAVMPGRAERHPRKVLIGSYGPRPGATTQRVGHLRHLVVRQLVDEFVKLPAVNGHAISLA